MSLISKEHLSLTLQTIKTLLSRKADKTDVVQSDWSQNNETALDYVKNRTHYTEIVEESTDIAGLEYNIQFEHNGSSALITEHNLNIPLALGQVWSCTLGSDTRELNVFESDDGTLFLDGNNKGGFFGTQSSYHIAANTAYLAPSYGSTFGTSAVLIGVSGTFAVATETIHHLDHKYIKDMYYTETKTLSETREFTGPMIIDLEFAQLLYEHRKDAIYTVDGVNCVYVSDLQSPPGLFAWSVASESTSIRIIVNNDKISFAPNGSITVNYEVEEVHHLDPKYIKDMYYEEENIIDITGSEYYITITENGTGSIELIHDLNIPFALGQIWSAKGDNYENTNLEVKKAEDGTLYVGTYPDVNDIPFYITSNTVKANGNWVDNIKIYSITLTCVSGTYIGEPIVHKLDPKYLPDEAQSDWNQNNPEDAGYIANRTHYDDDFVLTSGTINTAGLSGDSILTELAEDFVDGKEYIVRINGEDYSAICKYRIVDSHTMYYLGAYPPEMTEESWFSVMYYTGTKDLSAYVHSSVSCPVTIEVIQKDVKQLDPKYIKDMYYEEEGKVEVLSFTLSSEVNLNSITYTCTRDEINIFKTLVDNNTEVDVSINDTLYTLKTQFYNGYFRLLNSTDNSVIFEHYSGETSTNIALYYKDLGLSSAPTNANVSFYGNGTIVHKLDEKYIPNTIARVEDIPNLVAIDTTLAIEGAAADAKATGDAISAVSALIGDAAVSEQISSALAESAIPTPTTAQVGQILAVKAVDENGKPTEWETVNMVGGETVTDDHINSLIDAKLGVIENGTY